MGARHGGVGTHVQVHIVLEWGTRGQWEEWEVQVGKSGEVHGRRIERSGRYRWTGSALEQSQQDAVDVKLGWQGKSRLEGK